jgi:hypothetical protein
MLFLVSYEENNAKPAHNNLKTLRIFMSLASFAALIIQVKSLEHVSLT